MQSCNKDCIPQHLILIVIILNLDISTYHDGKYPIVQVHDQLARPLYWILLVGVCLAATNDIDIDTIEVT